MRLRRSARSIVAFFGYNCAATERVGDIEHGPSDLCGQSRHRR
jgi:hypothetical protein